MPLLKKTGEGTWYGPYLRSYLSGPPRRQVTLTRFDGTKTSMSYARWLMQEHLGRELLPTEHVDHIDEDCLNDSIENLQILTRSENSLKAAEARGLDPVCSQGHNEWSQRAGRRVCLPCNREHQKRYAANRRAKKRAGHPG